MSNVLSNSSSTSNFVYTGSKGSEEINVENRMYVLINMVINIPIRASTRDLGTYHIGKLQRLRRACSYACASSFSPVYSHETHVNS